MEDTKELGGKIEKKVSSIMNIIKRVITAPEIFFKEMPKEGGLRDPLLFILAIGVICGFIQVIISILGLGYIDSPLMAFFSIIIMPIVFVITGFIGAFIIFIIWKAMGSEESFETAYRCGAYTGAIGPAAVILGIIPYLGSLAGIVWTTYLLVIASIEVHSIEKKTARMVFGTICVIFSLFSLSGQCAQRRLADKMENFQMGIEKNMSNIEEMTPEEAGKAVGEFLKGFKQGTGEQ